jgi:hypothetical protein
MWGFIRKSSPSLTAHLIIRVHRSNTISMSSAPSAAEYKASRAHSVEWMNRAKRALVVRNTPPVPAGPAGFFHRFAHNYGVRHIHTNSFAPLLHMMLIIAGSGMTMQYVARHSTLHFSLHGPWVFLS